MPITREISEEIKAIVDVALKQVWMDDILIKSIADKISKDITSTINKKLKCLEKDVAAVNTEINRIKNDLKGHKTSYDDKVNELNVKISKYEEKLNKIDKIEQENKINNLWIFQLPEKNEENTKDEVINLINKKLNMQLSSKDIESCYRVGKKDPTKRRGIFIRFHSFQMKRNTYLQKKLLKGTGVVIREDLTTERLMLLNQAKRKYSLTNVWTDNGKIFCKVGHNILRIKSINQLND